MTGPEFADLADDSAQPEPEPQRKRQRGQRIGHPDGWQTFAGYAGIIAAIALLFAAAVFAIFRWWAP